MKFFKRGLTSLIITTFMFTVGSNIYNAQEVFAAHADRTISVTGNSSVTYQPNMAQVNVGIVTRNEDTNVAQQENNIATNDLIEKLTDSGIDINDISTSFYHVSPINTFNPYLENETAIQGYIVENNLLITIRNLDDIGDILDIAVDNGANSIYGIRFSNSNTETYYLEALEKSILDATKKANVISNAIGYELGDIISVTEQPSFYSYEFQDRGVALSADASTGTVPVIAPTDLTISASVNLVFGY